MAQKFALFVGCNEYQDPTFPRLKTPSKDIQDLAALIKSPEIGNFNSVITLLNKPFSTIQLEIAKLFKNKNKEDLLLLYFSGHGVLDEQGRLYLATLDTQRNLLSGTAVSANFILDEMENSRSKRQLLILDSCNSGAFSRGTKGVTGQTVITRSTFKSDSYGRAVLTATNATQYAWEGNRIIGTIKNSLFTHYLIHGLSTGGADLDKDGKITPNELYHYTFDKVTSDTENQKPQFWTYGQEGEPLIIARNPNADISESQPSKHIRKYIGRDSIDIGEAIYIASQNRHDPTILFDLLTKPMQPYPLIYSISNEKLSIEYFAEYIYRHFSYTLEVLGYKDTPQKAITDFLFLIFFIAMLPAAVITVGNTYTSVGLEFDLPRWIINYKWTYVSGSLFTMMFGSLTTNLYWRDKKDMPFANTSLIKQQKAIAIFLVVSGLISSITFTLFASSDWIRIVVVLIPINIFVSFGFFILEIKSVVNILLFTVYAFFLLFIQTLALFVKLLKVLSSSSIMTVLRIALIIWIILTYPFRRSKF